MNKFIQSGMGLLAVLAVTYSAAFAADGTGEYLKVQEPQYSSPSGFSVFSYVLSLLVTFGVVIALAYFTSKFWGGKFRQFNKNSHHKILLTLPLGQNRAVYVVEIIDEYFVLGVTDHNITLLQKITSPEQIEQLKAQEMSAETEDFGLIFRNQLHSLKNMSHQFPAVFGIQKEEELVSKQAKNQSTDVEKR